MMISSKGRYALRVMIDLAEHAEEGYIPLQTIAARQGISEKYLESILAVLSKAKLLDAVRGKGGGYRLARPAAGYTAFEILSLTEGTLAPVTCLETGQQCENAKNCRTLPLWQGLDRTIADYLGRYTLADLRYQASMSGFYRLELGSHYGCACAHVSGDTLVVDEILPDGSVLPALLKKIPAASCRVRTAGGNAPFAMCKWLSEEKKLPDVYLAFDFG